MNSVAMERQIQLRTIKKRWKSLRERERHVRGEEQEEKRARSYYLPSLGALTPHCAAQEVSDVLN